MIRLGIDTGGTFTDLLRLDENGMKVHKIRSTPDDPSRNPGDRLRIETPDGGGYGPPNQAAPK